MTNLYSQARPSSVEPLAVPKTALTVGAHPDDAEFGAGGTLAKWAAAGCSVTILVISDGSKGTWDPALTQEELVASRMAEQRKAADVLGVEDVVMLGHPDGELENTMDLRRELAFWIRRTQPEVLLSHDPWKRYMLHPDHRAAGMAAIDAVVAARDHLFFPDQLGNGVDKHRPGAVLLWSADEHDHWEDIAATFDTKIEALLEHSTQGPTTMGDAQTHREGREAFVDRIRTWSTELGAPAGIEIAEAFKRLTP